MYKVGLNDLKLLDNHFLQKIEGHSYGTISLYKRVIRDLLSVCKYNGSYMNFDKPSLLRWMIADVKGKSNHYAAIRLQVVYRYIEYLCDNNLLPDNPLREIKPKFRNHSWYDMGVTSRARQYNVL